MYSYSSSFAKKYTRQCPVLKIQRYRQFQHYEIQLNIYLTVSVFLFLRGSFQLFLSLPLFLLKIFVYITKSFRERERERERERAMRRDEGKDREVGRWMGGREGAREMEARRKRFIETDGGEEIDRE